MNPLVSSLIGAGVRWAITMLATREIVVSDDQSSQLVGAAVVIASLVWSVIQKSRAHDALKKAEGF